jgi:hypothetical protein
MTSQQKTALGSAMASIGGAFMVAVPIAGWSSTPGPWPFVLGFLVGVLAGVGAVLAVHGLIELRRAR